MRTKSLFIRGIVSCCALVALLVGVAVADEIEVEGRKFVGEITQGFPERITILADGVTANIDRQRILSITFETPPRIETTTGHTFRGQISSTLSEIITIRTAAGPVDVPLAKILAISFPHKPPPEQAPDTRVFLADGRNFNGNLDTGVPDPLDIKERSTEVVAHIALAKIQEISYGETDVVRTVDNQSYEGEIVSRIPTTLSLNTIYGSLEISQEHITLIRFLQASDNDNNDDTNWLLYLAIGGFLVALILWLL